MARQLHTLTVTVSAPATLRTALVRRELRSLINDQCNFGSVYPILRKGVSRAEAYASGDYAIVGPGDLKVRKIV